MQKMKILFVTASISFGGAAKMLCFVAESLAARGHAVAVANLRLTGKSANYDRTLPPEVRVLEIPQPNGTNKNIHYVREICAAAKKVDADVLVGFTLYPNMYAMLAGRLLHIPSVMSERGDPARTSGSDLKSRLSVFFVNRSRGGVFQTEGAMQFYGRGLQRRGAVIPNPIFVKGEIPAVEPSMREKTVVSVGRFDNVQKRYDVMLDAFKLFSGKHPDYVLKLYGKDDDEAQIRAWVTDRGLADKVRFMGLTAQPMQDIARDSIFLITSDFEGISNSLLEAMAVGLPCVSTDHTPGGARLLIQNGENGLLAPVGDVEKLAAALCAFAEDGALAARCGENAKQVLERFAPARIIDAWESYLGKVCCRNSEKPE